MEATGTLVLADGGAAEGAVEIGRVDVVDGVVGGGALEMAGALDVTATETPEIGVDIADTKLSEV